MRLYEAAKDALKVAQQADNVDLIQKLLDVQKGALEMQHQIQIKNEEVLVLTQNVRDLQERKKYIYEDSYRWLIASEKPEIKLCPTCMNRDNFESPLGPVSDMGYRYWGNCKNSVN